MKCPRLDDGEGPGLRAEVTDTPKGEEEGMKVLSKRTWIVLGLIAAVAALASVGAYAYFTSTGTGNGTGQVGEAANWTVVGGSEAGDLFPLVYPGGAQPLLGGSVTNPGGGYQNLNQIVATILAPTGGSNVPNPCTAADFAFSSSTWTVSAAPYGTATISPNVNLAPGGVYNMSGLNVSMVDNGANQDGCQNAQVNIRFDAS
jgi:hypothetical protein